MWLTLPFIFVAVAAVMAMIAEGVARTFVEFEPLEAYRLDIAGSHPAASRPSARSRSLGAAGRLGHGRRPSLFAILLTARGGCGSLQAVALLGLVLMLGRESLVPEWSWSPYYKVQVAR